MTSRRVCRRGVARRCDSAFRSRLEDDFGAGSDVAATNDRRVDCFCSLFSIFHSFCNNFWTNTCKI